MTVWSPHSLSDKLICRTGLAPAVQPKKKYIPALLLQLRHITHFHLSWTYQSVRKLNLSQCASVSASSHIPTSFNMFSLPFLSCHQIPSDFLSYTGTPGLNLETSSCVATVQTRASPCQPLPYSFTEKERMVFTSEGDSQHWLIHVLLGSLLGFQQTIPSSRSSGHGFIWISTRGHSACLHRNKQDKHLRCK